ncbi:hypothetical protein D9M69_617490 [compost metagenome]
MSSQAARSSSLSGVPLRILATLLSEWKSSPSSSGTPRDPAHNWPRLDLPQPATPMTTRKVFSGRMFIW